MLPILAIMMVVAAVTAVAWAAPFAYVTNSGSNDVSVIDTATNTVVATIPGAGQPSGVAITPDGAFAYLTNASGANTVSVIDTASNTVVASIPVGDTPAMPAITPNGAFVYVPNQGDQTVSVIETASNTVVDSIFIATAQDLFAAATTPDGASVYVTDANSTNVFVIATASNTVVATVTVGFAPAGIAVTPNGAFAYVVNQGGDLGGPTLSVLATATNTVVATVAIGVNPFAVALTPNGAFAYVTDLGLNAVGPGTVFVITTATNTVVATVPVGDIPAWVAITPDGDFAYVPKVFSNDVSVIATASNTVVATIAVGDNPIAVAITPLANGIVPFAAFGAKVEIDDDDEFEVNGTFTLGTGSDGIDIPTEIVSLQLSGGSGAFSLNIPAGSFEQDKKGRFKFEGVIDGVELEAVIRPLGGDAFEFKAEGEGADLTGIANPVTVNLTIGNDSGSTTVEAEFE